MSLLDMYRRNTQRKRDEIARLQKDKATAAKKIADLSRRINTASQAASRTKSISTANSKLREIGRLQNDVAREEKKIADTERKIANKQKELCSEETKIAHEEKKQADKNAREYNQQMQRIDGRLKDHDQLHQTTQNTLKLLQQLPKKITVLLLASNPLDQQSLRLDEEVRSITKQIRLSEHRDSVELKSCWAVRPLDILQAINEHAPAIIHFSGHGSSQEELVLQDASGNSKLVTKEAIVQAMMVSADDIRLVFFNTCYSHFQAEAVVQHIDAAIGMNTAIGDAAARVFAAAFYSAIGYGLSVGKSFQQAKTALMLEGIAEENTPELFIRSDCTADDIVIVQPENIVSQD